MKGESIPIIDGSMLKKYWNPWRDVFLGGWHYVSECFSVAGTQMNLGSDVRRDSKNGAMHHGSN